MVSPRHSALSERLQRSRRHRSWMSNQIQSDSASVGGGESVCSAADSSVASDFGPNAENYSQQKAKNKVASVGNYIAEDASVNSTSSAASSHGIPESLSLRRRRALQIGRRHYHQTGAPSPKAVAPPPPVPEEKAMDDAPSTTPTKKIVTDEKPTLANQPRLPLSLRSPRRSLLYQSSTEAQEKPKDPIAAKPLSQAAKSSQLTANSPRSSSQAAKSSQLSAHSPRSLQVAKSSHLTANSPRSAFENGAQSNYQGVTQQKNTTEPAVTKQLSQAAKSSQLSARSPRLSSENGAQSNDQDVTPQRNATEPVSLPTQTGKSTDNEVQSPPRIQYPKSKQFRAVYSPRQNAPSDVASQPTDQAAPGHGVAKSPSQPRHPEYSPRQNAPPHVASQPKPLTPIQGAKSPGRQQTHNSYPMSKQPNAEYSPRKPVPPLVASPPPNPTTPSQEAQRSPAQYTHYQNSEPSVAPQSPKEIKPSQATPQSSRFPYSKAQQFHTPNAAQQHNDAKSAVPQSPNRGKPNHVVAQSPPRTGYSKAQHQQAQNSPRQHVHHSVVAQPPKPSVPNHEVAQPPRASYSKAKEPQSQNSGQQNIATYQGRSSPYSSNTAHSSNASVVSSTSSYTNKKSWNGSSAVGSKQEYPSTPVQKQTQLGGYLQGQAQKQKRPETGTEGESESVVSAFGATIETPKSVSVASLRSAFNTSVTSTPLMPMHSNDPRIKHSIPAGPSGSQSGTPKKPKGSSSNSPTPGKIEPYSAALPRRAWVRPSQPEQAVETGETHQNARVPWQQKHNKQKSHVVDPQEPNHREKEMSETNQNESMAERVKPNENSNRVRAMWQEKQNNLDGPQQNRDRPKNDYGSSQIAESSNRVRAMWQEKLGQQANSDGRQQNLDRPRNDYGSSQIAESSNRVRAMWHEKLGEKNSLVHEPQEAHNHGHHDYENEYISENENTRDNKNRAPEMWQEIAVVEDSYLDNPQEVSNQGHEEYENEYMSEPGTPRDNSNTIRAMWQDKLGEKNVQLDDSQEVDNRGHQEYQTEYSPEPGNPRENSNRVGATWHEKLGQDSSNLDYAHETDNQGHDKYQNENISEPSKPRENSNRVRAMWQEKLGQQNSQSGDRREYDNPDLATREDDYGHEHMPEPRKPRENSNRVRAMWQEKLGQQALEPENPVRNVVAHGAIPQQSETQQSPQAESPEEGGHKVRGMREHLSSQDPSDPEANKAVVVMPLESPRENDNAAREMYYKNRSDKLATSPRESRTNCNAPEGDNDQSRAVTGNSPQNIGSPERGNRKTPWQKDLQARVESPWMKRSQNQKKGSAGSRDNEQGYVADSLAPFILPSKEVSKALRPAVLPQSERSLPPAILPHDDTARKESSAASAGVDSESRASKISDAAGETLQDATDASYDRARMNGQNESAYHPQTSQNEVGSYPHNPAPRKKLQLQQSTSQRPQSPSTLSQQSPWQQWSNQHQTKQMESEDKVDYSDIATPDVDYIIDEKKSGEQLADSDEALQAKNTYLARMAADSTLVTDYEEAIKHASNQRSFDEEDSYVSGGLAAHSSAIPQELPLEFQQALQKRPPAVATGQPPEHFKSVISPAGSEKGGSLYLKPSDSDSVYIEDDEQSPGKQAVESTPKEKEVKGRFDHLKIDVARSYEDRFRESPHDDQLHEIPRDDQIQANPPVQTSSIKYPLLSPSPKDNEAYRLVYYGEESPATILEKTRRQNSPVNRKLHSGPSGRDKQKPPILNTHLETAMYYESNGENDSYGDLGSSPKGSYPDDLMGEGAADFPDPDMMDVESDVESEYGLAGLKAVDEEHTPGSDVMLGPRIRQPSPKMEPSEVLKYWATGTASHEEQEEAIHFDETDQWLDRDPDFDFHDDDSLPPEPVPDPKQGHSTLRSQYEARRQRQHNVRVPVQPGVAGFHMPHPANANLNDPSRHQDFRDPRMATPEHDVRKHKSKRSTKKKDDVFDPFGCDSEEEGGVTLVDASHLFSPSANLFPTEESFSPPDFGMQGQQGSYSPTGSGEWTQGVEI